MSYGDWIDAQRSNLRYSAQGYFDILIRERPEESPDALLALAQRLVEKSWDWANDFLPNDGVRRRI